MVEPFNDGFILRGATPTPTTRVASSMDQKELPSNRKTSSTGSPVVYDTVPSVSSSGAQTEKLGDLDSTPDNSMYGDARGGRPDQSLSNRRRSPRSPSSSHNHHRPPNTRTSSSSSSARGYVVSPAPPTEKIHNVTPPPGFQGSALHYPAPVIPYAQRPGYRQYVMPAQPPMSMEHPQPPHFGYTHAYHYPGIQDGHGLIPQSIHASYQQILQPSSTVYSYQSHSPDGIPGAHNAFSNPVTPPIYPHLNTSPPMHSPVTQSPQGQSGAHSTSYRGSGQFRSLQYPSSMSPTQYAYPPQSFPNSSHMYPGQYAPPPYSRHFPSPQEPDRQGTWWYLPHSAPGLHSPQYENGAPSYQGHYPMTYAAMGHHEMDSYSSGPPNSNSPTTSRMHSTAPLRPGLNLETGTPSPHILESVSPINADTTTSPSSERPTASGKPAVRKSYHPNPPTHRSEWVMWAGNVSSDATHDELWRFFNKTPDTPAPAEDQAKTGVLSIFLISRSSCAFINFETEHHLHNAIEWFNGKPLRPLDPRCPRLVCRVRRKDDDLKAGVGGQRGMGMHTRWIKEQKAKGPEHSDISETSTSDGRLSAASSDQLAPVMSSLSLSDDEGRFQRTARHSSSSGSFASTNSSVLSRYFPNRFFILKSLTQFDLDLSVEKGLWATQKHNEGILDQAYRTSQNVYLIFSVNKSGEFYGYARMAGPVRRGEHRVSWATRTAGSSGSSRSSLSPITGRAVGHPTEEPVSPSRVSQLKAPPKSFFNTPHLVDESPQPAGSAEIRYTNEQAGYIPDSPRSPITSPTVVQSAPAELGTRPKLTMRTPMIKHSLDYQMARTAPTFPAEDGSLDEFELDPTAPIRAIRGGSSQSHESTGLSRGASVLQAVAEEEEKGGEGETAAGEQKEPESEAKDETWGESFKVEWLCTDKLPFHRTRHIRNPWNHDREVKVSRDGTEVEPIVGQRLLDEWERLVEMRTPSPTKMGGASKRGSRSAPPVVTPVPLKIGKQADAREQGGI